MHDEAQRRELSNIVALERAAGRYRTVRTGEARHDSLARLPALSAGLLLVCLTLLPDAAFATLPVFEAVATAVEDSNSASPDA